MIRNAAMEYNKAEYKFYKHGFVKFVRECKVAILIEDIYVIPEFRGTPISSLFLEEFENYMREENILFYYGRVFKSSDKYEKRISTFKSWGMKTQDTNDGYTIVNKRVQT